jgi:PAS domain S-box-containing protein
LAAALPEVGPARRGEQPPADERTPHGYMVALLAAVLAVLACGLLDPLLGTDHAFVLPLLAVVAVAWYQGFGPGVVTLLLSMSGVVYWFVEPVGTFAITKQSDQIASALFLFVGFACALLGEAHRNYRFQADGWLAAVRAKQAELEAEVARRQLTEKELRLTADELAAAQRRAADTLAQLDAFYQHTPIGLAFFDPDLKYVRVNKYLADGNRLPAEAHVGKTVGEVHPQLAAEAVEQMRAVVRTGRPSQPVLVARGGADPNMSGPMTGELWQTIYFPVTGSDGRLLGVGKVTENVTERARADRALRESEARFRTVTQALPQIIWVTRPDGYHEYFNERWYQFTGLTEAESLGDGWNLPLHPDDVERTVARWRHSLATGEPYEIEYRFRAKDGSYRWFLGQAVPQRDEAGRVVRWFGTLTDIDDFRKLQAEVRASEDRFRTLADSIPALAWEARPDGHIIWYNRRWYEYTGTAPADMEGWGWQRVHDPAVLPAVLAEWRKSLATGERFEMTFPLRGADGRFRRFLTRVHPARDASGRVVRWFGTNTDVEDQMAVEARLRASEQRFRDLADSMPQIVYTTSPDGPITFINRRWQEYTGHPAADPETVMAALHPDDREGLANAWAEAQAGERVCQAEFRLMTVDGQYRWFLTRAVPVRGEDGRIVQWYGTSTDVDDLKRLQQEVQASAERFRVLTEAIPQLVWNADAAGRVTYFNRRWQGYTGLTAGNALSEWWPQVVHPDDAQRLEVAWRKAIDRGGAFAEEVRVRRASDGQYRWFLTAVVPLYRADGTVDQWIGSLSDIHDLKSAQEAIRQSEERFRLLVEGSPQLIWSCEPDGRCNYLSRQWVEYTGVPMDEQLPDGWLAAVHPDDRGPTAARWAGAVAGRAAYDTEFRIRRYDGEYRWFKTRGAAIRDEAGHVVQWLGSCTDIDDTKRQSERLEALVRERTVELTRQREFLDAILDNVADGIVACDGDGRLTLFNRASREFHGLPAEPLPPDQWAGRFDLFEADGQTPMAAADIPLFRALNGERVRDAEMVIAPKGLPRRTLMASGQPLIDASGTKLGAVVSMRDITARKLLEEREQAIARELRRSNEELEKFAYVASHDLQEPLRKIQAFGDRLKTKQRHALGEEGQDHLDRILKAAGRMRTLINDLLAFSRVTTRGQPFARVDLNDVVAGVLSDLELRVGQTGAEIEVGQLPAVDADPTQMRQLFQNLIGNALKFHKPGEPPRVAVRGEVVPGDPTQVRLTVSDNGIGFDEKYLDRIFQVFQRLHGRDEYEGTGVGLAICRKIVERHRGEITARSRPGEGSAFVVTLPQSHPEPGTPELP